MRDQVFSLRVQGWFARWLATSALFVVGCGGNDYYYVNELKGRGDTVIIHILYACGSLEITWNGVFLGDQKPYAELAVSHEASDDCEEDPRDYPFDVAPMKQAFRATHDESVPLGLRVPPREIEHGAICIDNLFQEGEFYGRRCK